MSSGFVHNLRLAVGLPLADAEFAPEVVVGVGCGRSPSSNLNSEVAEAATTLKPRRSAPLFQRPSSRAGPSWWLASRRQ